jgi:hypothetical protein
MLVSQSRPMCWYSRRLPFSRKGTWRAPARLENRRPRARRARADTGCGTSGAPGCGSERATLRMPVRGKCRGCAPWSGPWWSPGWSQWAGRRSRARPRPPVARAQPPRRPRRRPPQRRPRLQPPAPPPPPHPAPAHHLPARLPRAPPARGPESARPRLQVRLRLHTGLHQRAGCHLLSGSAPECYTACPCTRARRTAAARISAGPGSAGRGFPAPTALGGRRTRRRLRSRMRSRMRVARG